MKGVRARVGTKGTGTVKSMKPNELAHLRDPALTWAARHENATGNTGDAAKLILALVKGSAEVRRALWGRSTRHTRPPIWNIDLATTDTALPGIAVLYNMGLIERGEAVERTRVEMTEVYGAEPNTNQASKFFQALYPRWRVGGLGRKMGTRQEAGPPSPEGLAVINQALMTWGAKQGNHRTLGDDDDDADEGEEGR